jgi:predicted DsbA family dithiol-disulfide isomerase
VTPPVSETAQIRIRVDYDFASSLCYVAHRVMERLAPDLEQLTLALDWSPIDLSGITGWRRGAVAPPARRTHVLQLAQELGVPLRMPARWLDSRPLHAIALALPSQQRPLWRERVWTAIYEEGMLPDADDALTLARSVGLEVAPAALERGDDTLAELTRSARAQRVSGVPNFMLGEWPFGGIQTDDTMRKIFARYATKRRRGEVK